MQVQVLNNVAAATGVPSGATAGVPLFKSSRDMQFIDPTKDGFYDNVDEVEFILKMTGTAVLSISYLRLWGYFQVTDATVAADFWAPLGTGTDTGKGQLNGGAALGEVTPDVVLHAERVRGLRECMRVFVEVGVITGTAPVIDAWLVSRGQAQ